MSIVASERETTFAVSPTPRRFQRFKFAFKLLKEIVSTAKLRRLDLCLRKTWAEKSCNYRAVIVFLFNVQFLKRFLSTLKHEAGFNFQIPPV